MFHRAKPMMYTPHPHTMQLGVTEPDRLLSRLHDIHTIRYEVFSQLHDIVGQVADIVIDYAPHFVPIFATSSIPVVFPVMERLITFQQRAELVDNQVFHLFSGLAWDGSYEGMSPSDFFISEAIPLLQDLSRRNTTVRVLCVDTTNTGNAVNLIVRNFECACRSAGVTNVELRVIGVVNAVRGGVPDDQVHSSVVTFNNERRLRVLIPSGYAHDSELQSGQFAHFRRIDCCNALTVYINYWIADDVFTEDEAALVGASRIPQELGIAPNNEPGGFIILFENGRSCCIGGRDSLGVRLYLILSVADDVPWPVLRQTFDMGPATEEERIREAEQHEMVIAMMELDRFDTELALVALNLLCRKRGLLEGYEIQWLCRQFPISDEAFVDLVPRVRAALQRAEDGDDVIDSAIEFFSRLHPDWVREDRSMPREWWLSRLKQG